MKLKNPMLVVTDRGWRNVILDMSTRLWNILGGSEGRMQAFLEQWNDAGTGCKANGCTYEVYKCLYAVNQVQMTKWQIIAFCCKSMANPCI